MTLIRHWSAGMLVNRDHRISGHPSVLSTCGMCRDRRGGAAVPAEPPRRCRADRLRCRPSGRRGRPAPHRGSGDRAEVAQLDGRDRRLEVRGDRLPDRRLSSAARAGYQKQHSVHHGGVGNRFNAASDAHPVVSAVCRRCSIPTSTLTWSNGRLRQVPSARCGWTCRGRSTTSCRVPSPPTCWWWGRVTPGCGRHCMPHSAIRTSESCSSTPSGWDGRHRVATAASSTPA